MARKILLPYYGNKDDVRRICEYLRIKPQGARESEITHALSTSYLDPRKFDLFDLLGFFLRDGGTYRLTERGFGFLRGSTTEQQELVRQSVRGFRPYHALLEWVFHNSVDVLDADTARHRWSLGFRDEIDLSNEHRLQAAPLTFFAVCEFAGLGTFTVGRRGAKSRIQFDRDALAGYVNSKAIQMESSSSSVAAPEDAEPNPSPSLPSAQSAGGALPKAREFEFAIPIYGKVARLLWDEPSMTVRERDQLKRVLDAMFPEDS